MDRTYYTLLRSSLLTVLFLCLAITEIKADEEDKKDPDLDSLAQTMRTIPAFGIYKDNYLISGTNFSGGKIDKNNSDIKFQVSLWHRLFNSISPLNIYMFITYSQKSFWDIYRRSAPFSDNNYNPGIGVGHNFIQNNKIVGLALFQVEHESNGRDSIASRSWNKFTLTGIRRINKNFSLQAKIWVPFLVAKENRNILNYNGIGHIATTYVSDNARLWCSFLVTKRGGWNFNANFQIEAAWKLFPRDNQYLFLQFYNGYGESLLKYNEFKHSLRLGIVIKPRGLSIY